MKEQIERNTRKILQYSKEIKNNKIKEILNKNKKEVNINGFGTHRYIIKEGVNKGKML